MKVCLTSGVSRKELLNSINKSEIIPYSSLAIQVGSSCINELKTVFINFSHKDMNIQRSYRDANEELKDLEESYYEN